MNKRLNFFLHVAIWAFMFISPLAYLRGTGWTFQHYLINCMTPLLMMVVFYVNYLWLTPKYFVVGKRRYFLLMNTVMVVCLGLFQHYWMDTYDVVVDSPPLHHEPTAIDVLFLILRDIINLAISATVATAIVLAMRWQHNEEARTSAEAARTEAELKSLRSQINPHFLLNTLNNIYALTAIDTYRAQNAIQQLSKLLRHMLYDNQQETVALMDEIQFLENYVNLMKIRLPQSVDVTFTKEVLDRDIMVAPLIFISLIENAFKHGVSLMEPSFIRIVIKTVIPQGGMFGEKQLICSIENSYFPKTEEDRSGHGIGLEQVQRRLDLLYPDRYVWERGIGDDKHTYYSKITIRL